MQRPWLAAIVVIFWCTTTSWLFFAKILPSLLPGSPPGQQALYAANNRLIPVAWTVLWQDQPLGWAISQSHRREDGGMSVESRLHFDRLPLDEILPGWLKSIAGAAIRNAGPLTLDARGGLSIDAAGRLASFRSTVDLPGGAGQVFLSGTVDDGEVTVLVLAKEMRFETSRHLPSHVMLGDELSPQATIPGLYTGRSWTAPVYNPLRSGKTGIDVLHARVDGEEAMFWDDRLVQVHVVAYRNDPAGHHEPRTRLWVDRDGRVLRQETTMFGAKLSFLRRTDAAAETLAQNLAEAAPP